jgi:hypothetical protein
MLTWIVLVMTGTGGTASSSVTLDQINDGYICDLLDLCQLLRKAELDVVAHFNI